MHIGNNCEYFLFQSLNESIVGFSNQMDIDVGARQILATMERRRFWGTKAISKDTLKKHFCKDVLTFDESIQSLIDKKLVINASLGGITLNLKKKKEIESYL